MANTQEITNLLETSSTPTREPVTTRPITPTTSTNRLTGREALAGNFFDIDMRQVAGRRARNGDQGNVPIIEENDNMLAAERP